MAATFQYPCHPSMDPRKRYKCPVRFGLGKVRRSKCKQCSREYTIKLSPNGPIITEIVK